MIEFINDSPLDKKVWYSKTNISFIEALLLMKGLKPTKALGEFLEQTLEHDSTEASILGLMEENVNMRECCGDTRYYKNGSICHSQSYIRQSDWAHTLKNSKITDNFFNYPKEALVESENLAFLDAGHPYYTDKLAAAIKVWNFLMKNPEYQKHLSPKKRMIHWLTENAEKLNLSRESTPNKQAIEHIAIVANWRPQGGVSPTPVIKRSKSRDNFSKADIPIIDLQELQKKYASWEKNKNEIPF